MSTFAQDLGIVWLQTTIKDQSLTTEGENKLDRVSSMILFHFIFYYGDQKLLDFIEMVNNLQDSHNQEKC